MTSPQEQLNAAFAKHQAGDVDGAVTLYRRVLAADPHQSDALHMLGVVAEQMGKPGLALGLIDAALKNKPDIPFAWHNRSLVLRALGRCPEALESSQRAVALDPQHAEAWNMLAILARETNDFQAAFKHHKQAIELQPGNMKLRSEYALSLYVIGDLKAAYRVMSEGLAKDDTLFPLTLANILKSAGYPERALPYFRRAAEMVPASVDIKASEAMARLQIGDYAQGWELWEQRPQIDQRYRDIPLWKGEAVDHLLLYEDQGIGDVLQFIRYLPTLRDRARRITLQVAPALQRLMAENFPDLEVISSDSVVSLANARMRLTSLPYLQKTLLETILSPTPYLHIDENWRQPWCKRLAKIPKTRIGIVWAGNPDNHNDVKRSLSFAQLAPIIEAGRGHLISLQKGPAKAQADLVVAKIFDAEPFLEDFFATAGLLAELDLVITVCTSPAHLAGALGRPGWVMLAFDPHWPWLLGREDSPWYPTLRLFRQNEPGNWAAVTEAVAKDLKAFIGGNRDVLKPKIWEGRALKQNPHAINLTDNS